MLADNFCSFWKTYPPAYNNKAFSKLFQSFFKAPSKLLLEFLSIARGQKLEDPYMSHHTQIVK